MLFSKRKYRLFKKVFGTPEGEKVLEELFAMAGMGKVSHTPGDPYTTAYKDGLKGLYLGILAVLQADPKVDVDRRTAP